MSAFFSKKYTHHKDTKDTKKIRKLLCALCALVMNRAFLLCHYLRFDVPSEVLKKSY